MLPDCPSFHKTPSAIDWPGLTQGLPARFCAKELAVPLSHNITYSNITYSKLFALAFDYVDFKTTPAARRTGWLLAACMLGLALIPVAGSGADLSPVEQLGKQLFFDANLSTPVGQSCASCHSPDTGFSGPSSDTNSGSAVYPGAAPGRFGNRKPPSVAYASFSPKRTYKQADETWVGGQFWDGRSDDLIEQAQGPFLNPLEMNNASGAEVVDKVRQARYRPLFERVYGPRALDTAQTDAAFVQIATSIAAYETSREVNAFSSKYDAYLAKRATLTPQEERGLKLFAGQANCTACHPHEADHDGTPPLFTDFTYDNVGAPRNTANPFYQASATWHLASLSKTTHKRAKSRFPHSAMSGSGRARIS
jgi:cytochrome c peroxidase